MNVSPSPKPAWLRVFDEINAQKPPDFDSVRRSKLAQIQQYTGHSTIVHASACTIPSKVLPTQAVMIDFADIKAFETVANQLPPGPLDIILHTPGGISEAVEGIANVIRPKFNPVRFIIPHIAKSAGTMLALLGNEIIMHPNGELGPIDPQMVVGNMVASADAIISQFEQIRDEILGNLSRGIPPDPQKVALWGPILATMGPALLIQCENAKRFGKQLVIGFMIQYMFAGDPMGQAKAQGIADSLSEYNQWLSHGKKVDLQTLQRLNVHATDLATDPILLNLIDEIWAAYDITLANTAVVRITENNLLQGVMRMMSGQPALAIQIGPPPGQQPPGRPPPPSQQPPPLIPSP
jgi:hypothetical protein